MGNFTMPCYRPNPGKEEELMELVRGHYAVLQIEGLVTERPSYIMRSTDGTIIEIFEWKDDAATEAAHHNEQVRKIWNAMMEIATFPSLGELPEGSKSFPNFAAVE